jgi:hypothetical protein
LYWSGVILSPLAVSAVVSARPIGPAKHKSTVHGIKNKLISRQDFHFHGFRAAALLLAGRLLLYRRRYGRLPPDEKMLKIFPQRLSWRNVDDVFTEELRQTAESAK